MSIKKDNIDPPAGARVGAVVGVGPLVGVGVDEGLVGAGVGIGRLVGAGVGEGAVGEREGDRVTGEGEGEIVMQLQVDCISISYSPELSPRHVQEIIAEGCSSATSSKLWS